MIQVELYSKDDCHLCDVAYEVLFKVQKKIPFDLRVIKIREGDGLFEKYSEKIPVVLINGEETYHYKVPEQDFIQRLKNLLSHLA